MTTETLSELMIICGCQKEVLENPPTSTSKIRLIELNKRMEDILFNEYKTINIFANTNKNNTCKK